MSEPAKKYRKKFEIREPDPAADIRLFTRHWVDFRDLDRDYENWALPFHYPGVIANRNDSFTEIHLTPDELTEFDLHQVLDAIEGDIACLKDARKYYKKLLVKALTSE